MANIRVLIVDDSALIRKMLTQVLGNAAGIEVVGVASDPIIARDKIKQLNPDVLTLDVEMPRMNGIQFLGNLMRLRPMPVVMVSTLTAAGAPVTLEALEIGALDYIAKPQMDNEKSFNAFSKALIEKVRMAAGAKVRPLKHVHEVRFTPPPEGACSKFSRWVVLGASTGGTEAIKTVLGQVPANCPPILITQHIPAVFSASFAKRLDSSCAPEVLEASEGLEVRPGRVIVAHGDHHLTFRAEGNQVHCCLSPAAPVNRHRPSVEVMFDSITAVKPAQELVAVMLTGMGADGAAAMKRLHQSGSRTIAQDEASSVVYGMPKAVVDLQAADKVMALEKIAPLMMKMAE
ncbi:protein-glutamate methylesterase/protein-glutamine glutaminase [Oceanobacter kriegii]|uniref:protein-glutamate methylesterase/protein-glutamine glutaminase n=1 Tax=Oceanobacter kriegii TaxID=64972 RepID=UPI0004068D87|nr:chemotaxis response regulator protein-glutamate methylesterase [Oceanobacter kriegii]